MVEEVRNVQDWKIKEEKFRMPNVHNIILWAWNGWRLCWLCKRNDLVITNIWSKQQRFVRHVLVYQFQHYRTQIYRCNNVYILRNRTTVFYDIGSVIHIHCTIVDNLAVAVATANSLDSDETTASQSTSMQIACSCLFYYTILKNLCNLFYVYSIISLPFENIAPFQVFVHSMLSKIHCVQGLDWARFNVPLDTF